MVEHPERQVRDQAPPWWEMERPARVGQTPCNWLTSATPFLEETPFPLCLPAYPSNSRAALPGLGRSAQRCWWKAGLGGAAGAACFREGERSFELPLAKLWGSRSASLRGDLPVDSSTLSPASKAHGDCREGGVASQGASRGVEPRPGAAPAQTDRFLSEGSQARREAGYLAASWGAWAAAGRIPPQICILEHLGTHEGKDQIPRGFPVTRKERVQKGFLLASADGLVQG
nr:uncharacterized protein LOC106731393 [Pelodiscus sinensis]|eukprot:XP_014424612.1 uncharacterized protein LOC106731393 [Pelodiscus sinensis]